MKTQNITIVIIICILPFAACHVQKEKEKGLEKFRNGPLELCEAIENGNIKAVKAIIKKGIDVDLPAKKDEFPMFYAAGYGRPEIARLLIQAGANVNIRDSYGDTALHIAIRECNYKVAEILINSDADVNAKIEKGFFPGFRPLHTAVNGKKDIPYLVSLLISKGAEVNSRDAKGKTPLQYAIKNRFSQSEQILLKHEKSPGNIQKNTHFPVLKGPYLGQKPPGMTPEIFAPGIISTRHYENSITFSPDGNEIYYAIASPAAGRGNLFVILFTKRENNRWIRPQVASFSGRYVDGFPCISPDGKHLYFSSYRPLEENGEPKNDWDIWAVDKTDHGWSEPYNLGSQINTDERESSPTVTLDGTMYFKRSGSGYSNIYLSRPVNGKYSEPDILSNSINSETSEAHPFIAPDESYLLFSSWRRQDGFGEADIYVSFRKSDGVWTEAVNLGDKINTSAHENCPIISPDGRFFFFNSYKREENQSSYWKKPLSYDEVLEKLDTIYNGFPNIYWVDAKIIEDLKPDEMK